MMNEETINEDEAFAELIRMAEEQCKSLERKTGITREMAEDWARKGIERANFIGGLEQFAQLLVDFNAEPIGDITPDKFDEIVLGLISMFPTIDAKYDQIYSRNRFTVEEIDRVQKVTRTIASEIKTAGYRAIHFREAINKFIINHNAYWDDAYIGEMENRGYDIH